MTEKLVGDAGKTASQGTSVALSGNGKFLAVGGISDGSMAGAVWASIKKVDNGWMQFGEKITCEGALDRSTQGSSLALSGDGLTLASLGAMTIVVQEQPGYLLLTERRMFREPRSPTRASELMDRSKGRASR